MDRWNKRIEAQDEKLDVVNGLLEQIKVVNTLLNFLNSYSKTKK